MDMALSKGLDPTQDTALDCCPLRFWVFPLKAWSKGSRLRVTCTRTEDAGFQNIKQVDNRDRYTPEAKYSTSRFGRHKCFSLTAIRILRRIMIDESEILHWVWNDQTKQSKFWAMVITTHSWKATIEFLVQRGLFVLKLFKRLPLFSYVPNGLYCLW